MAEHKTPESQQDPLCAEGVSQNVTKTDDGIGGVTEDNKRYESRCNLRRLVRSWLIEPFFYVQISFGDVNTSIVRQLSKIMLGLCTAP